MKPKIILAACLLMISAGCKKNCMDSRELPDGYYAGTFRNTWLGEGPVVSHVTLRLHDGQFEGDSDSLYHPAICRGTFTRADNIVSFKTDCMFPDIPTITTLDHTWSIASEGDSVRLTAQSLIESGFRLTLKHIN